MKPVQHTSHDAPRPPTARTEIRVLGEFSVTVDGVPVRRWQAGKARAVFQHLLLERGRVVSREALNDALWPDNEQGTGSSSLRVAVHSLRRILASTGSPSLPALRLDTVVNGYLLDVQDAWVDVHAFDAAVAAATAAHRKGAVGTALAWHREATALYHGDLLVEESAPWVELRRHGLRSAALASLEAQLDVAVEQDDGPEIVELCRMILEVEPHREDAYRALILQHGRRGQLHQADSWFDLCSSRLHDDLGVRPDPRTNRVHQRAMHGDLVRRRLAPAS